MIHNLVPPFLIGEESLFLDETAEVQSTSVE
jgi:hypothetical protein